MSVFPSKEVFKQIVEQFGPESGYELIQKHKEIARSITIFQAQIKASEREWLKQKRQIESEIEKIQFTCQHPQIDVQSDPCGHGHDRTCVVCGKEQVREPSAGYEG